MDNVALSWITYAPWIGPLRQGQAGHRPYMGKVGQTLHQPSERVSQCGTPAPRMAHTPPPVVLQPIKRQGGGGSWSLVPTASDPALP